MRTKIPRSVIRLFIKNKKLDTLCFWMLMRHRYTRRHVFYNWSYRSIAEKMGVSPNTARRHVSHLIQAGMLHIEGKNLSFKGRNALLQDSETPIPIIIGKTKQAQILYLRNAVIAYNLIQQDKAIAKKISLVERCKTSHGKIAVPQAKMISKKGGLKKFEESVVNRLTLSNQSFGKLLDRSVSSAKRYKRSMLKKDLIGRRAKFEVIKTNSCFQEFIYGTLSFRGMGYSKDHSSIVKQCTDTLWLSGNNVSPCISCSSKIAHV